MSLCRSDAPAIPPCGKSLLGDVFVNGDASSAASVGLLNSLDLETPTDIRVAFRNYTSDDLVLCWVGFDGGLHHHYCLPPCVTSVTGTDVGGFSTAEDGVHVETTTLGHAFVLGNRRAGGGGAASPCWLPPFCGTRRKRDEDGDGGDDGEGDLHVVAGYRSRRTAAGEDGDGDGGPRLHLVTVTLGREGYHLDVRACAVGSAPLDTSDKPYRDLVLGGWPTKCDVDLFSAYPSFRPELAEFAECMAGDLRAAAAKLPPVAREALAGSTLVWIDASQKYGSKCAPTTGRALCFHGSEEWVRASGMTPEKYGGVELYCASEYCDDEFLWGRGGVMLHELSHAYHRKFVAGGFDNGEVRACYEAAMEEGLYDSVGMHTVAVDDGRRRGPNEKRRAYACTNEMEYFAELSTAFLGGVGEDGGTEYNKWFPFNRKELREHDPRAYVMLKKIWKVDG